MMRSKIERDVEKIDTTTKRYKNLINNPSKNKKLKQEVDALYDKLGVKTGTALDLSHIPLIEKALDISIKVVSIPHQLNFIYKGSKHPTKSYVYLAYSNTNNDHIGYYDLITNVKFFFQNLIIVKSVM
jgi:hypothetical protein